jgi:Phage-related minor tail protein
MNRLEKLLMRIDLIDRVTAPANKIMASIDKLSNGAEEQFKRIGISSAALYAIGFAMNSLTADSRDMQKALGEVKSLSVNDEALQKLERTSLKFSIAYGESASNFVRSAYDIQSAISGLTGDELSRFTNASNILAKGTKSDAGTITNYMGTMYGIFKKNADAMGKSQWVEQLAGQTAQAVEMFKTTGVQMSSAFTSLGADAQAHGVAINEQMAVLGKLQATMGGNEAGTKYKAFLRGVGQAQEELGLKFTDSAGRMLPVDTILGKLQGKFGEIDTVAESDVLKKAFGSDEAVAMIKLLIADTNGLTNSIDQLGRVTGMDKARQMAAAMVDPMDQLIAVNTAVRISFGKVINQAMYPFYDAVIEGMSTLNRWIDMFPNLTKLIAKLVIGFFAFSAVLAILAIAKAAFTIGVMGMTTALGILRIVMIPFGPLLGALRMAWFVFTVQLAAGKGVVLALRLAMIAFSKQLLINLGSLSLVRAATWLYASTLGFLRAAVLAAAIRFPAAANGLLALRAGFMAGVVGAKAFAAALLLNPITWIVMGVVALIAGIVLLVRHWDTVKMAIINFANAVVEKWKYFRSVIEDNVFLSAIFAPLLAVVDVVSWVIGHLHLIPEWFSTFSDWISGFDLFQPFRSGIEWVMQKWSEFRALLENNAFLQFLFLPLTLAVDGVGLLLDNLKKIPEWFAQFKNWMSELSPFDAIGEGVDWLIDKLNMIPGVNIGKSDLTASVNTETPAAIPPVVEQFSVVSGPQNNTAKPFNLAEITSPPASLVQPTPATNIVQPVIPPAAISKAQPASVTNLVQPTPVTNIVQPVMPPAAISQTQSVVQPASNVFEFPMEKINQQRDEVKPQKLSISQHVPEGGLRDQISNSDSSKTVNIEKLEVKTTQKINGYNLADELLLAGG